MRYSSPTEGVLTFGTSGPFAVDGVVTPLRNHPRHRSPWGEVGALVEGFDVADGPHRLQIDVTRAARRVT